MLYEVEIPDSYDYFNPITTAKAVFVDGEPGIEVVISNSKNPVITAIYKLDAIKKFSDAIEQVVSKSNVACPHCKKSNWVTDQSVKNYCGACGKLLSFT